MFKDNRNIASPLRRRPGVVGSSQLEAQIDRMEQFLSRAETVLTQLLVAAKRLPPAAMAALPRGVWGTSPRPGGRTERGSAGDLQEQCRCARPWPARGETFEPPPGLFDDETAAAEEQSAQAAAPPSRKQRRGAG